MTALTVLMLVGASSPASSQWNVTPKAALPSWPLWWTGFPAEGVEVIPLLWSSDVDGSGEGCCVLGAAMRRRSGSATLWLGLAAGTDPDAGTPAAFEIAVEVKGGAVAFRRLHGRNGFAAFVPLAPGASERWLGLPVRVSAGLSGTWIYDERYVQSVVLFDCPVDAPAVPCRQREAPYPWSEGRDYAFALEGVLGDGSGSALNATLSLIGGLRALDGDHDYLRVEAIGERTGNSGAVEWAVRLGAGWASGDAPLQRRFHLDGGDPITRWLNPYLDARGALLSEVPYHVPGGAGLRAYHDARPLVKRYVAARGEVRRTVTTTGELWGRMSAFLEGAWTPALPERIGPDGFDSRSALLFDWRDLPPGEGEALGQFMARVLNPPEVWADVGLSATGGYHSFSVTLAVPFWASEAALADEPLAGGRKKALGPRWSLTVAFERPLNGKE
jgi:hypothetical protein